MQVRGLAGWHLVFDKGFAEVGYLRTTDANTPTLRAKKNIHCTTDAFTNTDKLALYFTVQWRQSTGAAVEL